MAQDDPQDRTEEAQDASKRRFCSRARTSQKPLTFSAKVALGALPGQLWRACERLLGAPKRLLNAPEQLSSAHEPLLSAPERPLSAPEAQEKALDPKSSEDARRSPKPATQI